MCRLILDTFLMESELEIRNAPEDQSKLVKGGHHMVNNCNFSFNGYAEALGSIHHKLSELSEAQTQPSIYKVHKQLRDINDKAYEPYIMAIGPYHHGKANLRMMEQHKVQYLKLLLQRKNENVERYFLAVAEMEQEARNCYAEPISFTSAKFIEMLLLDGCFIIELIRKRKWRCPTRKNDPIFQTAWIMAGLKRDLILFENQIPFIVLCKLYELIEAPNQHDRLIDVILSFCKNVYAGELPNNTTNMSPKEAKHLLDLIYRAWCPSEVYINVKDFPGIRAFQLIPSAMELRDVNVKFQKKKSNALFDIDFKEGLMLMPPLKIEDWTECFFRNLIAYEQYLPRTQPTPVVDYVMFLDCLINSSKDVEILSRCGIINNWMGDNEEVANIINQLGNSVIHGKYFVYAETFCDIDTHCKKRWNRARAVLNRDYFNSRWAYVSFVAALLLLLLSTGQTVFSALQVFKT